MSLVYGGLTVGIHSRRHPSSSCIIKTSLVIMGNDSIGNNNKKKSMNMVSDYSLTIGRYCCCCSASNCSNRRVVMTGVGAAAAMMLITSTSTAAAAAAAAAAAKAASNARRVLDDETLNNIPQMLSSSSSGDECTPSSSLANGKDDCNNEKKKKGKIQRPKSRKAESCTLKCVTTCIRGGAGEGPLNAIRPLVVFKQGFRTRQYCLVECSDICNLIKESEDEP